VVRVHPQEIGRLSGRHRQQAGSHRKSEYIRESLVGYEAAFASKPAPTVDRVNLKDHVRLETVFAGKPRAYRGTAFNQ